MNCFGGPVEHRRKNTKNEELRATAFMATPTYVLGMADTARKMGIDQGIWALRKFCVQANEVPVFQPLKGWKMPGAAMYMTILVPRKWEPGDMSVLVKLGGMHVNGLFPGRTSRFGYRGTH